MALLKALERGMRRLGVRASGIDLPPRCGEMLLGHLPGNGIWSGARGVHEYARKMAASALADWKETGQPALPERVLVRPGSGEIKLD